MKVFFVIIFFFLAITKSNAKHVLVSTPGNIENFEITAAVMPVLKSFAWNIPGEG